MRQKQVLILCAALSVIALTGCSGTPRVVILMDQPKAETAQQRKAREEATRRANEYLTPHKGDLQMLYRTINRPFDAPKTTKGTDAR